MYIWLLISKSERQAAGARAKATNIKSHRHLLEKRAEHPPAEKQGRGDCIVERSETTQSPLPCFPAGILERYRIHRTNYFAEINKLLTEYQWNVNGISTISRISSKWGAPLGGGRERPKAAGWAGGLPRRAPVQGSGERQ